MQKIILENKKLTYAFEEEIKQLRTNLEFTGIDRKVILMTSSITSEGKSTLSLELAKSLAQLGKNTLFLDADMRMSSLVKTRVAGIPPKGLSQLLSGQCKIDEIVLESNTPNLFVITSGRIPPNPSELLASSMMSKLIKWARNNFDYVIIDCPPLKPVSDSSIIAPYTDGAVLVVKAGFTSRKLAAESVRKLQQINCPILGVVINQVQQSKKIARKYGYDYYIHPEAGRKVASHSSHSSSQNLTQTETRLQRKT